MLRELTIGDFAIIDHLHLTWSRGLNVLTGETGAGKSIVVDALGFVMGERASSGLVRSGARGARVEAMFEVLVGSGDPVAGTYDGLLELLAALDVALEDGCLVLARELSASGRNTYRINGHMVTQANLREVAAFLVEVHGQHESQGLLSASRHVELLDRLAGEAVQRHRLPMRQAYERWHFLREERDALLTAQRERERRLEWLAHEVAEIEGAQLVLEPDELESLRSERQILTYADKIQLRVQESLDVLDRHEGDTVRALLGRAQRLLGQLVGMDPRAASLETAAEAAACAVEELVRDLSSYADGLEADPRRLEQVNERLDLLGRLQRKYGATLGEIAAHAERSRAELERLQSSEQRLEQLEAEIHRAAKELGRVALDLSRARRAAAELLEVRVAEELERLEMKGTRFAARFRLEPSPRGVELEVPVAFLESPERDPCATWAVSAQGLDRFEFLIAPNLGQPLQPLAQIASGGEMARVMLAMQAVLCEVEPIGTLVFDEVDAGLGGVAAEAVASRLQTIARARQVLCITHLPLVAAAADTHWYLRKEPVDGQTRTRAQHLDVEGRTLELARMLAGNRVTETTLAQANELLARATATSAG